MSKGRDECPTIDTPTAKKPVGFSYLAQPRMKLYSRSYTLVFSSTLRYHYRHRRMNIIGECQTPRPNNYLRPLQSRVSDRIFHRSSRITRILQWLFSLSLINNLFGCNQEHLGIAKNVLAETIIQRRKALLYKDFMSKVQIYCALHPTFERRGLYGDFPVNNCEASLLFS